MVTIYLLIQGFICCPQLTVVEEYTAYVNIESSNLLLISNVFGCEYFVVLAFPSFEVCFCVQKASQLAYRMSNQVLYLSGLVGCS